jgi:phosphoribosylglycinamide formyltransferase-1
MNKRVGIFISGRGSNLKAAIEKYGADKIFVFSNKKNAPGLKLAKKRAVPFEVLKLTEEKHWLALSSRLQKLGIKKVLLLGFMKIVPESFLKSYKGQIINLHPSVLPDFPGLHSIEKSLKARRSVGVSLHHVNENMDEGPLIFQSSLNIQEGLELDLDIQRVHSLEQVLVGNFLRLRGAS